MIARSWDELWKDERQERIWSQPDPYFLSLLPVLESDFRLKSLDLGCGLGRHTIHLANVGFDVTAIDSSLRAVEHCKRQLVERDLPSKVCYGSVLNLPFQNCQFDVEVAWNVIYHGTRNEVEVSVSEIRRTMRKDGLLLLTLISTRHATFGEGTEVELNTFLNPKKEDGMHLHHYSTEDDVQSLLSGWFIESISEREEIIESKQCPGSWHWMVLARNNIERS